MRILTALFTILFLSVTTISAQETNVPPGTFKNFSTDSSGNVTYMWESWTADENGSLFIESEIYFEGIDLGVDESGNRIISHGEERVYVFNLISTPAFNFTERKLVEVDPEVNSRGGK